MECKRCEHLLAVYKDTVRLYRTFVERIQQRVGADRQLAHKEAEHLRLACVDAENTLSQHRHQDHTDLAKSLRKAGT
jgi:hypothetical protein